jgi:hypothetical protein
VCVCVYVRARAHTHTDRQTDTHTHTHTHTHKYVHTHMYVCIYVYMYVCVCVFIHKYILTYLHTYIRIYVHTFGVQAEAGAVDSPGSGGLKNWWDTLCQLEQDLGSCIFTVNVCLSLSLSLFLCCCVYIYIYTSVHHICMYAYGHHTYIICMYIRMYTPTHPDTHTHTFTKPSWAHRKVCLIVSKERFNQNHHQHLVHKTGTHIYIVPRTARV